MNYFVYKKINFLFFLLTLLFLNGIASAEWITKKSDIYYRVERIINKKQMGHLFKVMLIKNENNNFKLGF